MKSIFSFAIAAILFVGLAVQPAMSQNRGGGAQKGNKGAVCTNFVDANGDGICDLYQAGGNGANRGQRAGKGYGPGNGTGNMGAGPKDGSGYGPGNGTGVCTGTCTGGGQMMRRGRRQ